MKYGSFNFKTGGFEITTPRTPTPWKMPLFNDNYATFVDQLLQGKGSLLVPKKYNSKVITPGNREFWLKDNASDKFLEIIETVDVKGILIEHPSISAIVTAGEKATITLSSIFESDVPKVGEYVEIEFENRKIKHYRAPSSSRAYPLSLEKKAEAYETIFKAEGCDISEKKL